MVLRTGTWGPEKALAVSRASTWSHRAASGLTRITNCSANCRSSMLSINLVKHVLVPYPRPLPNGGLEPASHGSEAGAAAYASMQR